jgi:hypothetical protein
MRRLQVPGDIWDREKGTMDGRENPKSRQRGGSEEEIGEMGKERI